MKKFFVYILFVLGLSFEMAQAQNNNYNIQRAIELMDNNNFDEAVQYLKKEVEESPKSARAHGLLGYIYMKDEKLGLALTSLDKAVKYSSKKDKKVISSSYYYRAYVHELLGDTTKAIEDYKAVIKLSPEDRNARINLSDIYFARQQFDEANKIYEELKKINPGDAYPYYGIARNLYNQDEYDKAREEIKKAEHLDSNKPRAYIMRMRIEQMAGNLEDALDFGIKTLREDDNNDEAYYGVLSISDSIYQKCLNRVIKEQFENSENEYWGYLLSMIYIRHDKHMEAINSLRPLIEANGLYKMSAIYWSAECYENLEDLFSVVKLMDMAIEIDSTDADLFLKRADSKFYLQDLEGAEQDYRKILDLNKEYGYYCFYRIGWIKEMQKKYNQALECYNMSIALNENNAYTYMMKGNLLKDYLGKTEEANEAFRKCIILDNGINNNTCKQYAYLGLGDIAKAISVNDSIIATFDNAGAYYDAACLYSRLNKKQEAISFLSKSFEKGFKRIRHAEKDDDLDNIRNTNEYQELIRKYSEIINKVNKNESKVIAPVIIHEIPIKPNGDGTFLVKCYVNELPMEFILDTGCSDVSLSSVESEFMLKNGYLKSKDFIGSIRYNNASGESHTAKEINLKAIKIGEVELKNIKASIVPNQKAPLLLGQSVLRRLGKYEIDPKNNILKFYAPKK